MEEDLASVPTHERIFVSTSRSDIPREGAAVSSASCDVACVTDSFAILSASTPCGASTASADADVRTAGAKITSPSNSPQGVFCRVLGGGVSNAKCNEIADTSSPPGEAEGVG